MNVKFFLLGLFSKKILRRSLYIFCTCSVFGNHVGGFVYCKGVSMLPTMQDGDIAFAERFSVLYNCLHRNDIICLKSPNDSNITLCKRLVLKEFDTIHENEKIRYIPKNHYYVLGDNLKMSTDSRHFGVVPYGLIQDRVVLRLWPLQRFGWISSHYFWQRET